MSRITETEDRISEVEDKMVEINEAERKKKKKFLSRFPEWLLSFHMLTKSRCKTQFKLSASLPAFVSPVFFILVILIGV